MKPGLDRRQWLRLVGAGATGALFSCGDNERLDVSAALLEPSEDGFMVAVWSATAHRVDIEVRTDGDLVGTTTLALTPGAPAALDVTSLEPDRRYEVTIGGAGPYRVQTAPRADDARPVRLAVSADCDPSPEFDSDLLAQIVAAEPELMITIGDCPYTDNGPPAMTVDEYRQRHVELRSAPRVRALHEAVGFRAIYDDHEFRNDWDAHWVALEPARYAAAMQVWDEFFPLRGGGSTIKYRSWRWGAGVECFMLDCRRFRSANAAPDDAAKTMLGADQRDWLIASVAKSTATFKLILTSVPLDYGLGDDHWASFTTERDAIFAALAQAQTPGILFVSGDQHWFAAHRHAYGIREFQIGPLARGLGMPGPAAPGVLFRSVQYNAGIIDIDGDELTFTGLGAGGQRFYSETLTPAALTPRASPAR